MGPYGGPHAALLAPVERPRLRQGRHPFAPAGARSLLPGRRGARRAGALLPPLRAHVRDPRTARGLPGLALPGGECPPAADPDALPEGASQAPLRPVRLDALRGPPERPLGDPPHRGPARRGPSVPAGPHGGVLPELRPDGPAPFGRIAIRAPAERRDRDAPAFDGRPVAVDRGVQARLSGGGPARGDRRTDRRRGRFPRRGARGGRDRRDPLPPPDGETGGAATLPGRHDRSGLGVRRGGTGSASDSSGVRPDDPLGERSGDRDHPGPTRHDVRPALGELAPIHELEAEARAFYGHRPRPGAPSSPPLGAPNRPREGAER